MNSEILEQATEYFVDFSQGDVDAAVRERFDQWLRRSPEHVRAYLQVTRVWEDTSALGQGRKLSSDELVERALRETNVVALKAVAPAPASGATTTAASTGLRGRRMYWPSRLGIAASFLLAAVAMWIHFEHGVYRTTLGEQRSIVLDDGTTIDLNSRSRIRVKYTDHERVIELLEGQGLFKVAKDPARPFIVDAEGALVRAVGTQFDVYRKPTGTRVTVIEGRVAVLPGSITAPRANPAAGAAASLSTGVPGEILLAAGEQLDLQFAQAVGLATLVPQPANLDAATAWTRRQIVFNATPLSEVIAEFNRYNARQLIITDGSVGATRISGVFSSTDPDSLLRFLSALPTVRVVTTGDEIRILAKGTDAR